MAARAHGWGRLLRRVTPWRQPTRGLYRRCLGKRSLRCPAHGERAGYRPGIRAREKEEIDYRNIKRPTLIVAGGKDPLREPGYAQALQEEIAGSELVLFPEAGHFAHLDCPDRFNEIVTAFLSR